MPSLQIRVAERYGRIKQINTVNTCEILEMTGETLAHSSYCAHIHTKYLVEGEMTLFPRSWRL